MLSVQAEEMLEQLEKAQNRIFAITAVALLSGFFLGLLAAWLMK